MNEYDSYYEFYDLLYGEDQHDVPFYLDMARKTGGPVCELACGTGRVLLPLAREGFDVTGLDVCQAMLDRLQAKLSRESRETRKRVTLVRGDMREHRFERPFKLVFCAFNSFLHLKATEDQLRCLETVRSYLADDGRLVVSIFAPRYDWLAQKEQVTRQKKTDPETGRDLFVTNVTKREWRDQTMQACQYVDRIGEDGTVRRLCANFSLCWIFNREMLLLLRLAGYEVEAVYGDYNQRPYDYVSGIQLFVARKQPVSRR